MNYKFANKVREYDLSYETNLRFSSHRLDVYFHHDSASFSPPEFRLEAVLDRPLTIPSLVAPSSSSNLRNNTAIIMTFLDPPFPLA